MVASHVVSIVIAQIPSMSHSRQVPMSPSSTAIPSFGAPSKTYPSLPLPTSKTQLPTQLRHQRSNRPPTPSFSTTAPLSTPPLRSSPKRAKPTLPPLPSHPSTKSRDSPHSCGPTPRSHWTTMEPTTKASFITHLRGASNSPFVAMLDPKRLIGSPHSLTSNKRGPH